MCGLNDNELDALAKKTALLINGVGPYCLYGETTFKSCATNGTHYLDVTGEFPWVHDMIKKYEATAKASGSIMISQIGIESALSDLATWTLVQMIKERFSTPTADVVLAIDEMKWVLLRQHTFQIESNILAVFQCLAALHTLLLLSSKPIVSKISWQLGNHSPYLRSPAQR